jgi:hypothetical protein
MTESAIHTTGLRLRRPLPTSSGVKARILPLSRSVDYYVPGRATHAVFRLHSGVAKGVSGAQRGDETHHKPRE